MRTLFYMIGKYELTLYTFRYYWVESNDCYFAKMIRPFFDRICMPKDLASIQTVALSIICNFVAVARPAAAQERRRARGPQADSRNPGRMCECCPCKHQIDPFRNYKIGSIRMNNHSTTSSGSRAVRRAGVTGVHSRPWRPPLTPRPRGTIYEALPFTLRCFLEGTRLSAYPNSSHAISDMENHYGLVCKIMDDLESDGQMEISL